MKEAFLRVLASRKVQVTFLPFLISVIYSAINGVLTEEQITNLLSTFYSSGIVHTLILAIAGEDVAKWMSGKAPINLPGVPIPPPETTNRDFVVRQ